MESVPDCSQLYDLRRLGAYISSYTRNTGVNGTAKISSLWVSITERFVTSPARQVASLNTLFQTGIFKFLQPTTNIIQRLSGASVTLTPWFKRGLINDTISSAIR